ncbi:molybdopterin converting factor subunit 1 [Devosia sp. J2-20]|jgi:sulfur-carrier protein|uniref:Molybdopterin converting factor subunit 1 n=1 Tax=Devosia litorisediminis TaxID=2829817 RepID=A0A942I5B4_9HYPH|nr:MULTISPECIES: molybdopterin converting factor subunit 1 [Devosia]MBS3847702.1 molybdopterin converting factor subunit 1 [Devosia litorisediminis]MCZ4345675.1 molybdopterin converting factor subunit 1 [Devosia neptuniae]WDQ99182.1 molybdopterin converting factor subunit 1 [Devosia sp. J2-20]|tara:strand:- start:2212 stop:2463 length:252 start_codon:yes stop_codon:yes gene_type:complete
MKILYFAWLRERLNRGSEEVSPPDSVATVGDLIDWLAERDEAFAHAVAKRSLIKSAVDAKLVPHETPLAGASTVAFFPPMTGG